MVKSHGLEREFLYIDASFCAKIFRDGIRGRAGIQEWQHAVQKTLPPARIEPAIQVREGKRVGGERELPCSDVVMPIVAAIERAGPARAESLRRRKRNMTQARLQFGARPDLLHWLIQEWREQRRAGGFPSPLDGANGLRLPGKPRALPTQIATHRTAKIPAARNIPSQRAGRGYQIAHLREITGQMINRKFALARDRTGVDVKGTFRRAVRNGCGQQREQFMVVSELRLAEVRR